MADVLGRVAFWLYRNERHLALKNVRCFYPDANPSIQRTIVRQSFQHMVQSAFDLIRFATEESDRWPTVTIKHLERMQIAISKGRGVVVITGHYGNLEILVSALKNISSCPGLLWYKPTRELGWVVDQFRRYRHEILTPKFEFELLVSSMSGVRRAAQLLRGSNVVIMAADLIFGSGFIPVTFLDRTFPMSRVPASLALRTRAILLPVITVRCNDGHYNIIVEEAIEHPINVTKSDSERMMTESFARILAHHIESTPEQWCWTQLV